jgi:His-Xaa-Ser repeat protein HxsA
MKKATTTLTMLISSLLASIGKSEATVAPNIPDENAPSKEPVSLRPLNLPGDNLFAAHRSHSSHASHRSSSGSGYAPPATPDPQKQQQQEGSMSPVPGQQLAPSRGAQPTDPGRAAPVTPTPRAPAAPQLSMEEKLKLQIMRVQIALTSLGIYTGPVNGELDSDTKEGVRRFQTLKGLEASGLMTTETLNALGVPAVQ